MQMNAPRGNKPCRARSRRGHLPESSTTTVEPPYQVSGKPSWLLLLLLWVASKCVGWWQPVQRELWPFSEAAAADSTSPTLHTTRSSQPSSPWLLASSASPSQLQPFPPCSMKGQPSPKLSPLERAKLHFMGAQGLLSVGTV